MKPLDVTRIREDFPVLKREVHGKPLVYLDNAALGAEEAVRASFMFYNTREEADALASALEKCIQRGG